MNQASALVVHLDGRPRPLASGATLDDLVTVAGHAPGDVATAVNGRFVAREQRAALALADGDEVLFFQPIVGG